MATEHGSHKILYLCTGNSARSIFAEYLTNKIAKGRFEAFSAGSEPAGKVNPFAVQVLNEHYQIDARQARSKSWDEFRDTEFDIIITVCDRAKNPARSFRANRSSPIGAFPTLRWLRELTANN